jgi:hypothetical protein
MVRQGWQWRIQEFGKGGPDGEREARTYIWSLFYKSTVNLFDKFTLR